MANKPPSKRLGLLRDRNAKLSAQVSVQSEEIERLQRSLHDAHVSEQERQEAFLVVNRLWEELNDSIAFLSFRYVHIYLSFHSSLLTPLPCLDITTEPLEN